VFWSGRFSVQCARRLPIRGCARSWPLASPQADRPGDLGQGRRPQLRRPARIRTTGREVRSMPPPGGGGPATRISHPHQTKPRRRLTRRAMTRGTSPTFFCGQRRNRNERRPKNSNGHLDAAVTGRCVREDRGGKVDIKVYVGAPANRGRHQERVVTRCCLTHS
jgi:hypothetical protein